MRRRSGHAFALSMRETEDPLKPQISLLGLALFSLLCSQACSPAVKQGHFPTIGGATSSASSGTNSAAVLALSPSVPMVNETNSIPVFASGGSPPYVYNVLTVNGGYFSGNLFTATTVTGAISAQVLDSKGKQVNFTIQVIPTR